MRSELDNMTEEEKETFHQGLKEWEHETGQDDPSDEDIRQMELEQISFNAERLFVSSILSSEISNCYEFMRDVHQLVGQIGDINGTETGDKFHGDCVKAAWCLHRALENTDTAEILKPVTDLASDLYHGDVESYQQCLKVEMVGSVVLASQKRITQEKIAESRADSKFGVDFSKSVVEMVPQTREPVKMTEEQKAQTQRILSNKQSLKRELPTIDGNILDSSDMTLER